MRLIRVIIKEIKEFVRDKGFLAAIILLPLVSMLINGYTFNGSVKNLNTIVIDNDKTKYAERILKAIEANDTFKVLPFKGNLEDAKDKIKNNQARVVFYIPSTFGFNIKNGFKGEIYLFLDSSDYMIYNILKGTSGVVVKETFKDIVKLIVEDLENEQELNQQRVGEIQLLITDLKNKTDETLSQIQDLSKDFSSTKNILNDTDKKVINVQTSLNSFYNKLLLLNGDFKSITPIFSEMETSFGALSTSLSNLIRTDPQLEPNIRPLIEQSNQAMLSLAQLKNNYYQTNSKFDSINNESQVSLDRKTLNLDKFYSTVNSNEEKVDSINDIATNIKQSFGDIENRTEAINVELRSLKKDFLSSPLTLNTQYYFGEISFFQYLTPSIIALTLFFIGVMLTVLNLVAERDNGTFFRITTTPLSKTELMLGKFCVFFIVGLVETIYFILLATLLFKVKIMGSVITTGLILLLLMTASVGLGLLISSGVRSMKQAVMITPMVIIPSIMVSQIFSPVEVMPLFMQKVANITPLYHANIALHDVMIKGADIYQVKMQIFALLVHAIASLTLGILISKNRIK